MAGGGGGGGSMTSTSKWCNDTTKAYGAVVLIRMIYAGMILLSKAAFDGGLNTSIFVFYRQAFATVVIAPIAFFLEWKHAPPLSLPIFCKIFVLCFCGMTLNLNLNGVALKYTSATLAAASTNSIPVITFFLALLLGMETLKVRTRTGVAKVVGVVICLGGVATLAFYKGPHFKFLCFFKHLLNGQNQHPAASSSSHKSWVKGCFLMLSSNFLWSIWLVFQTIIMKSYPSKLMLTALQCLQSSIQSLVVAVAVERDLEEWKLGWNMRLLAVTYCGVVVNGVTYYLLAWILEKKGPVFVVITTPLTFIFTMLCSALLCYSISLGSVLGAMLLVGGLYSVLWAKGKEGKIKMEINEKKMIPQEGNGNCSELTQAQEANNIAAIVVVHN